RLTMIMRGTTPRTLTAGGWLAVLGLAAVLLPLMPGWAQEPPRVPAREPSAEEQRARAELAQTFAEVAQLRAQLQAAEARLKVAQVNLIRIRNQTATDLRDPASVRPPTAPAPTDPRAHSDELAQARTEVLTLRAQLEIKQALLQEGRVRLEA